MVASRSSNASLPTSRNLSNETGGPWPPVFFRLRRLTIEMFKLDSHSNAPAQETVAH